MDSTYVKKKEKNADGDDYDDHDAVTVDEDKNNV